MREEGEGKLLLTIAVGVGPSTVQAAYNITALDETLDWINLMTYDLYGFFDTTNGTGLHSQLYGVLGNEVELSGDRAVTEWINAGARREKLNLGIATYSRSYTLESDAPLQPVHSPFIGPGAGQPYSGQEGTASYYEMKALIDEMGATTTFDSQRCAAYLQKGTLWMGYDDVETMKCKAEYVNEQGLLGGFVWDLGEDDFLHGSPLLTTFSQTLGIRTEDTTSRPTTSRPTTPTPTQAPTTPTPTPTQAPTTPSPTPTPTPPITPTQTQTPTPTLTSTPTPTPTPSPNWPYVPKWSWANAEGGDWTTGGYVCDCEQRMWR